MTSLDNVLEDIGVCGPFQIALVVFYHLAIALSAWGMMMMAFGAYNPGWTCLDDVGFHNVSSAAGDGSRQLPTDFVLSASLNTTDKCTLFKVCQNVSFSPGSSTVASEWGLVCDRAWILKLIFSSHMAGVFVGASITGQIGEIVGRKASMYGMVVLHGVANLIAVFSPSWEMFTVVRFFIGIASGGVILPAYVTPLEFTGQFWRGFVTSLPTWSIGSSLFAISVIVLKDWRDLHMMAAVLSALVFLPVFWVPESFRWLAVHGKDKRATTIVTKIAKMNGRPEPNLELVVNMAESERRRALSDGSDRYTYLDLFRDRKIRKITIIMTIVWIFLNVVYYGISFGVQALSGNFYINFVILSVMELPSPLFCLPAVSFLTRRCGSALPLLIVAMACFGITIINLAVRDQTSEEGEVIENQTRVRIVVTLAIIAKLGVIVTWNVITVFVSELLPTAVRNLGFGFFDAVARIGGFLGPMLFPQDPAKLYLAMIVLGTASFVSFVLLLLLPETKGAPLEDTLRSVRQSHQGTDIMTLNDQNGKEMKVKVNASDRDLIQKADVIA